MRNPLVIPESVKNPVRKKTDLLKYDLQNLTITNFESSIDNNSSILLAFFNTVEKSPKSSFDDANLCTALHTHLKNECSFVL